MVGWSSACVLAVALLVLPSAQAASLQWMGPQLVRVTVDVDPSTGRIEVSICWEQDPDGGPNWQVRSDGGSLWVPQGTKSSDGSTHISYGDSECEFEPLGHSFTLPVAVLGNATALMAAILDAVGE